VNVAGRTFHRGKRTQHGRLQAIGEEGRSKLFQALLGDQGFGAAFGTGERSDFSPRPEGHGPDTLLAVVMETREQSRVLVMFVANGAHDFSLKLVELS